MSRKSKNHTTIHFAWHNVKCLVLKRIGAESGILAERSGKVKQATIIKEILEFIIEIHRSPEMVKLKAIEGGATLDILRRAFMSYSRHLRKPIRTEEPLHRLRANGNTVSKRE